MIRIIKTCHAYLIYDKFCFSYVLNRFICIVHHIIIFIASQEEDEFEDEFEIDNEVSMDSTTEYSTSGSTTSGLSTDKESNTATKDNSPPKTFTDYPWDLGAIGFVFFYIIYYIIGRSQNNSRVSSFTDSFKSILRQQFATVGQGDILFNRDTDSDFSCWCTGRKNIKGALIQLQLSKRQDLYDTVLGMISVSTIKSMLFVEEIVRIQD